MTRGARLVDRCYTRIGYLHALALLLYRKTVKLELELDDQQIQLSDQNDRHVHLLRGFGGVVWAGPELAI